VKFWVKFTKYWAGTNAARQPSAKVHAPSP
jgi:hypothetical protein